MSADTTHALHAPRRLRTDFFLTIGAKIVTLTLNSIVTVLVARALGPEGRGTVYVALGLMLILAQVGTLGLGAANTFFVARDPASTRRVAGQSLLGALVAGGLLVAGGAAVRAVFPGALPGLTQLEFALALAAVPAALAGIYLQGILLGLGRMVVYNGIEAGQALFTLVALTVGFAALDIGPTGSLAVIMAGFYVSAAVYTAAVLTRPVRTIEAAVGRSTKDLVAFSLKVYAASLAMFLLLRLDALLVNAYLGRSQAGLYSVATAIADVLTLIPIVVGINLFPRVSRDRAWEPTAEVFRSMALLYGAVCILTVPLAGLGIEVIFGSEYADATQLYYWLVPGIFSFGMLSILSHHFAGHGMQRSAVLIWVPGMAVNIAINVAFLEREGTYIASLASSIGYTLVLVLAVSLFAREADGIASLRPRLAETARFVRTAFGRT